MAKKSKKQASNTEVVTAAEMSEDVVMPTTPEAATPENMEAEIAAAEEPTIETAVTSSGSGKDLDIVVFGATGYTGELFVEYLVRNNKAKFTWALAGRSQGKLANLKKRLVEINPSLTNLETIIASVEEPESVEELARRSHVLLNLVGPYNRYHGHQVIEACIRNKCSYLDLAGEPAFIQSVYDRHDAEAKKNDVVVITAAGYDSVPADIAAYYTIRKQPQPTYSQGNVQTIQNYVYLNANISGGTFASILQMLREFDPCTELPNMAYAFYGKSGGVEDRSLLTVLLSFLTQAVMGTLGLYGNTPFIPHFSLLAGGFVLPMYTIGDALVVRRTADIHFDHYTRHFQYYYYIVMPFWFIFVLPAFFPLAVLAMILVRFDFFYNFLVSRFPSGTGPSKDQQKKSWFRFKSVGRTRNGKVQIVTEVSGADPYIATAQIYGELATMVLEKAKQGAFAHGQGGALSPAAFGGEDLINRLNEVGVHTSAEIAKNL